MRPERKLRAALDLVLGSPAAAPARGSAEPWHDPLARWALGALLERYCRLGPAPAVLEGPSEADAVRWARRFAADSFGDLLLATSLAALLRNAVPPAVQVGAAHAGARTPRATVCLLLCIDAPGYDHSLAGNSIIPKVCEASLCLERSAAVAACPLCCKPS